MCLVCGRDNPFGLHARFYELAPDASPSPTEGDGPAGPGPAAGRELLGVFRVREEHQSYPGRLHGGVSSAILDETIGRAILLLQPDAWGVTVEFSVRFRRPLPWTRRSAASRASPATPAASSRAPARSCCPAAPSPSRPPAST